ncbi:techylectin-5A isoform X2 [Dermacentor silvarum]|uniref:techylectin-5A isoform X2 n=1 Tax=Dermacentor silvarum TaxID=543639 RepID=UPI0021015359|nr:techylectin-5A isoform X2 [Dermacentor silvarum]
MASHMVIFFVVVTTWIVAVHTEEASAPTPQSQPLVNLPAQEKPIDQAEEKVRQLEQLLRFIRARNRPRQCSDLLRAGQRNNGVYTIYHSAAHESGQDVYCDLTSDGGGWTVIQRRKQNGNRVFHFYRNWSEYTEGFGNPHEEYWIGNKALHALTSGNENVTLRVVLWNSTQDKAFIYYNNFRVENEANLFKLKMGDLIGPPGWDAMRHHDGQKFSTFDRDNDAGNNNCAEAYRGGWWYYNCHACNPNGLNLNGFHESYADGIDWSVRNNGGQLYHYSFPAVEMMIRPASLMQGKESELHFFPPS